VKLVTVAEMQAIEREADASGLTYNQMMEHAGRGLAEVVLQEFGSIGSRSVLGLVGPGNNGGDTLVALAHLADHGWQATAYLVRPRPKDDPLVERLVKAGGIVIAAEQDPNLENLHKLLGWSEILLDGVLGTGFQLPLRGKAAEVLGTVKDTLATTPGRLQVVAVDCPSGVDCDSGQAAPESLYADLTVSMAAVKTGLLKSAASQQTGDLRVVSIGLETQEKLRDAWQKIGREVVDRQMVEGILPARPPDAHKGTFGTVLVVAGSVNYTGAALLAGKAAYRVGAGLVILAVPETLQPALAGHFPEATWLPLPEEMGVIASEAAEVIWENLERPTALLIGPGFGLEEPTRKFLVRFLERTSPPLRSQMGFIHTEDKDEARHTSQLPPLVIDADGLKLLAKLPEWAAKIPGTAVLTPHPGEMAILTGLDVAEIQADRLAVAERFARQWNHVVVLKGAHTVVSAPDGRSRLIPIATAALARAGTGDVLAGLIAGLRAEGVEAFEAATAGCWIHAQCGLIAEKQLGSTASVLAGDVLVAVSTVIAGLER
jgi:hydroxyethylthiazole kinase-like uncharacterized protein yjeF